MTSLPAIPLAQWRARAQTFHHAGDTIAYWTAGDPASPPLLLVHGFPSSSWDWAHVWEALAREHFLVAADMRGFGLSDKPAGGYSLHAQADLQLALLAHLGVERPHVLAHDYGVSVAQELLARNLEGDTPLASVYFLNGGLIPGQHRPRLIQRLGAGPLGVVVSALLSRKRFGQSFSAVFGPNTRPTEAELDDHWALVTHKGGHRRTHDLLHYMGDRTTHKARWVGALAETSVPLGILNGARDPVSGDHLLQAVLAEVPGIHATSLPDVGHYPQIEAPEATLAAYNAFRQSLG